MTTYTFHRWPPPLTTSSTPPSDTVEASTIEEACDVFATRHSLCVTEIGDTVWFETEDGADVGYVMMEV